MLKVSDPVNLPLIFSLTELLALESFPPIVATHVYNPELMVETVFKTYGPFIPEVSKLLSLKIV